MAHVYSGDFKSVAKKAETWSGPFMPLMYKANQSELIRDTDDRGWANLGMIKAFKVSDIWKEINDSFIKVLTIL